MLLYFILFLSKKRFVYSIFDTLNLTMLFFSDDGTGEHGHFDGSHAELVVTYLLVEPGGPRNRHHVTDDLPLRTGGRSQGKNLSYYKQQ